jgi:hypothetical protein
MTRVRRTIRAWAFVSAAVAFGVAPALAQEPVPVAPSEPEIDATADEASVPEPAEDRTPRLIGDAEALAASGMASAAEVKELSRLIRELKEALEKKAARLENGEATEEADASLETAAGALETSSADIAERAATLETTPEAPALPKEGAMAAFARVLEESAGVLERLKEIRNALGSAEDERAAQAAPNGAEPEAVEEAAGEVSGSVTENGQPVAGATVTDPETGAKATTDNDGLFHLVGIPAGRLVTLTAGKAGRPLGVHRVILAGNKGGLADFNGAAASPGAAAARLRPSIMRVRPASGQATGLVLGEVRDRRGRPAAGAAVALERLGVVRSDVRGRFAFLGVPVGPHRVTVSLRAHQPQRAAVRVAAKARAQVRVQLRTAPRPAPTHLAWRQPGAASRLTGVVTDAQARAVVGARIRLVRGAQAVSVVSQAQGRYAIRNVAGGKYHLLVSKAGFKTDAHELTLGVRESRTLNVRLAARPGAVDAARVPPAKSRRSIGAVYGRVIDGRTGRPVAGARLSLAGKGGVSDASGSFRLANLQTGSHRLVVQAPGFVVIERVVAVEAARDLAVTLPLTALRASSVPRRVRR